MIFVLSFLLSWLCGMFLILLAAFFYYDEFSIIDITSFAILTLAGCLILIPVIYLPVLKFLKRIGTARKQFIWLPASLILIANLPVYLIIWMENNDLYKGSEAILFLLGFVTTGTVFGICTAWKNKSLQRMEKA